MLAPMQYGGIGGAMSNIMRRVNPLIDQQEERSLRYDDQLRAMMMEQAKLDAEIGAAEATEAGKLRERAWLLKRDANKPQYIEVKDPVTGGLRIVPVTPGGGVAPAGVPQYQAYARGPDGKRVGYDGTKWVPVEE